MKRSAFKKLLIQIIVAMLMHTVVGCNTQKDMTVRDDSLQKVLNAGQLILDFDMGFLPMGFIDESGESVGFDIDMAREVCDRLGIALVVQGIDWDTKEDYLNDGRIDCIWNGLSVTPERAEAMNLTEPYMKNELIFVVAGSTTRFPKVSARMNTPLGSERATRHCGMRCRRPSVG